MPEFSLWTHGPFRPVPTALLVPQPDGVLVLAGTFDSVNGEPRRRLARLDPDGAVRGRLLLGLSAGVSPRLSVPGEVEIPYLIQTSPDLVHRSDWLINDYPWWPLEAPLPSAQPVLFFRAEGTQ